MMKRELHAQETKLMNNDYSVNLPTKFYYKKRCHSGMDKRSQSIQATIVLGTPGSGKSYAIVNNFIKQQIERAGFFTSTITSSPT